MTPAGDLQFNADVKEALVAEMEEQRNRAGVEVDFERIEYVERRGGDLILHHGDSAKTTTKALRVIVAIGRSGNFRKLECPGEELDKVSNRLHDPKDFAGKNVLVVGGGDSALEGAIALTICGANVTLSYRKKEFSRPKPDNIAKIEELQMDPAARVDVEHPTSERVTTAASARMRDVGMIGSLKLELGSTVASITERDVTLQSSSGEKTSLPNDAVFAMIGREAPLDFFRRSKITIAGEYNAKFWITFALTLAVFTFLYQWKKPGTWLPVAEWFEAHKWFPFQVEEWWTNLGESFLNPFTLEGTLAYVVGSPGFYFSIAYSLAIVIFGIRRIQRRNTPYVTRQTLTLMAVQVIPLFLLPYIILPWMGFNGWFDSGIGKAIADPLFPVVTYGPGREYWRAFGLILAWPLFLYNVFTSQPLWTWLVISLVQTFVIIPFIIWRWGKGAYCGWICSCGAMAETLGDTHRHKMPHGPVWNRANMIGQVFLVFAFVLLGLRILAWAQPNSIFGTWFSYGFEGGTSGKWMPWSYAWFVDLMWAGIIGFGFYFHFSGRVWCRFACPLAALMHIYARFSSFRIFADKKKCISCNVCTSVCHQGIDIMNFANKGMPMEDVECVRCSACVQQCPTGVLTFGHYDQNGQPVLDKLPASPVQMRE
jgi:thioredoxin reductase/ferredoxin